MSNGTVGVLDDAKIRTTVVEDKRTYYKLHPDQKNRPGEVITMPNLPDDKYHWDKWRKKGYATNPQELMPGTKLIKTEGGEYRFNLEHSPSSEFKCEVCGKLCQSQLGLGAHKRSHK